MKCLSKESYEDSLVNGGIVESGMLTDYIGDLEPIKVGKESVSFGTQIDADYNGIPIGFVVSVTFTKGSVGNELLDSPIRAIKSDVAAYTKELSRALSSGVKVVRIGDEFLVKIK
jgi:hypothetical protein